MILVVTANPALDVTYAVPSLSPGAVHRASSVHRRAGGKGVNVVRVLRALDVPAMAVAACGGGDGALMRADLLAAELPHVLCDLAGSTRRTVTMVAAAEDTVTLVNEPGPEVSRSEWRAVVATVCGLLDHASVLVCAGSLPPGVPGDAYAELIGLAHRHGVVSILDASGAALSAGVVARPHLVKPNVEELRAVTGLGDPLAGARELRLLGAGTVLASMGAAGLLLVTRRGAWRARPSRPVRGNTTGAGDAAVAGAALELASGRPWPEVLRRAVAVSASAVLGPFAGDIDLDHHRREYAAVTVEEIHAACVDV